MIKILIVDDSVEKVSSVQAYIEQMLNNNCEITIKNNLYESRVALSETAFDLMVLDIQFPEFPDSHVKSDAGFSLLSEILISSKRKHKRPSQPHRPSTIIVLTEYEDSVSEYNETFSESIFKISKYDGFTDTWQDPMLQSLEHATAIKENNTSREYDYDIGIICALDKEFRHILSLDFEWTTLRLKHDLSTLYYSAIADIGGRPVKLVCSTPNHMGITDSTIASMKMIENFKPRYMFMTGIMGGIKSKVAIGDIVVADPCYSHESGKYVQNSDGGTDFLPTSTHVLASNNLKSLLHEISHHEKVLSTIHENYESKKPHKFPNIHFGPVSSGNAVIADTSVLAGIKKNERNLLGVDMEIYGLYKSSFLSSYPKPDFIAFKGVTDYADDDKSDDFQDYCAHVSTKLLEILIKNFLIKDILK